MPDEPLDERTEKTPEQIAAGIAERKRQEALGEYADEMVKKTVFGGAVVGTVGVAIMLLAAFRDNVAMLIAAATIALVSYGVVSAAQAGKLFGRNIE